MTRAGPDTPIWQRLADRSKRIAAQTPVSIAPPLLMDWIDIAGLHCDFSLQHIPEPVWQDLFCLFDETGVPEMRSAMWQGEKINTTENRAAWHILLRQPRSMLQHSPHPEATEVATERERLLSFADQVHTQGNIRQIINIGIGGSDLGPRMVCQALRGWASDASPQPRLRVDFVSNVDGCELEDLLSEADPATTLFIVCSKTFTTQETMANAQRAKTWLTKAIGADQAAKRFAAVSTNQPGMDQFGVPGDQRFTMWDWVGGRFSVWSSIGLSVALQIGTAGFNEFLAGAHAMDQHFLEAPVEKNAPVLMALAGIWNINFRDLPTLAVLPYSSRLAEFPSFLQQLEMESNGKSVRLDGQEVSYATAPVVWGEPGNNAQHSFFQMLHQGTHRAAMDFVLLKESPCQNAAQQRLALANGLAQIEAFTVGQSNGSRFRYHPGQRPLSIIGLNRLTPYTLGALIALYEHKVFVQGKIWGINSFDQFGVELGKKICGPVLDAMESGNTDSLVAVRRWVDSGSQW